MMKVMLGASVKVADEDSFRASYSSALDNVFSRRGIRRRKPVYKAAHLTKQILHQTPYVIADILASLEGCIERVDIFSAYYNQPYVSCFGEAQGQRLLPVVFIERFHNGFPHVCCWRYLMDYQQEAVPTFMLDHFSAKLTPAWRVLEDMKVNMEVYYSGGECNPLIATADIVLRLIDLFQFGNVDGRSLLAPLVNYVPALEPKLRFHNVGAGTYNQHHTAPVINLDIDISGLIKKPTCYIVARDRVDKDIFEWGAFYNRVMAKATQLKGCVKFFDPSADFLHWGIRRDFVAPASERDLRYLDEIRQQGIEIPPILPNP